MGNFYSFFGQCDCTDDSVELALTTLNFSIMLEESYNPKIQRTAGQRGIFLHNKIRTNICSVPYGVLFIWSVKMYRTNYVQMYSLAEATPQREIVDELFKLSLSHTWHQYSAIPATLLCILISNCILPLWNEESLNLSEEMLKEYKSFISVCSRFDYLPSLQPSLLRPLSSAL